MDLNEVKSRLIAKLMEGSKLLPQVNPCEAEEIADLAIKIFEEEKIREVRESFEKIKKQNLSGLFVITVEYVHNGEILRISNRGRRWRLMENIDSLFCDPDYIIPLSEIVNIEYKK